MARHSASRERTRAACGPAARAAAAPASALARARWHCCARASRSVACCCGCAAPPPPSPIAPFGCWTALRPPAGAGDEGGAATADEVAAAVVVVVVVVVVGEPAGAAKLHGGHSCRAKGSAASATPLPPRLPPLPRVECASALSALAAPTRSLAASKPGGCEHEVAASRVAFEAPVAIRVAFEAPVAVHGEGVAARAPPRHEVAARGHSAACRRLARRRCVAVARAAKAGIGGRAEPRGSAMAVPVGAPSEVSVHVEAGGGERPLSGAAVQRVAAGVKSVTPRVIDV